MPSINLGRALCQTGYSVVCSRGVGPKGGLVHSATILSCSVKSKGLDNQQETNGDLSLNPLVGSSETIRQALVDLCILNPVTICHFILNYLRAYLAGPTSPTVPRTGGGPSGRPGRTPGPRTPSVLGPRGTRRDYGVACLAEGKDGGPLVLRPGRPGGPPRSLGP